MSVRRKPSLLWRLFVLVGLGSMTALSFSDQAWEQFEDTVGDAVPRSTIRSILLGTLAVHSLESLFVWRSTRRRGDAGPGRWALATFVWGFPVMRQLRKARKAEAMAVEAVALADEAVLLAEAA
jgi:hypothetical protein